MAIFVPRFLRQLRDIVIATPADGEVLTYDSADQKWKNEAGGGGGGPPTGAAGGVLGGTYPNPGFAVDMATQAELDAHVTDITDAHDATAVSVAPFGSIAATQVQAALEEIVAESSLPYGYAAITNEGNTIGGDDFIPLRVGFPTGITSAGYKTVTTGLPQTLGVNGHLAGFVYLPDALALTYDLFAYMEASNADGSEKLSVYTDTAPVWVTQQAGVKVADFTGVTFTVAEQIGSDLSRDVSATTRLQLISAAGGQFFGNIYAGFYIP